jgi:hypothetical protein
MGGVMDDWKSHAQAFDREAAAREPLFAGAPGRSKLTAAKQDVDAFNLKGKKGMKDEIFATFSASAAAAQGRGGSFDPLIKATEKQTEKIVAAIREGGVLS